MKPQLHVSSALASALLTVLSSNAGAQVHEQWARNHDGATMQDDFANAVAVGPNGNVYVVGRSFDPTTGIPPAPPTQDFETVAYDAAGAVLWSARYGMSLGSEDQGYAVAVSPAGDVYVAGSSFGLVGTVQALQQTVVKYASNGTQSWARQYGNTAGPNTARALLVDAAGDVFVGGQDGSNGGDMCVRKLDPATGNVVWTALFDGTHNGNDFVYALVQAPNGDLVAAGNTGWLIAGDMDIAVMRVAPAGNVIFGRELPLPLPDTAFDVTTDAAGSIYAAGQITTSGQGNNLALVKWDASGVHQWTKEIEGGSNGSDAFLAVAADPFGRVVAAGRVRPTASTTGQDWAVHVFDAAGNPVWDRTFDGAAHFDDLLRGLAIDAIGNIHVAGMTTTSMNPTLHTSALAIEYDPRGNVRYVHEHASSAPGTTGERYIDIARGPDASFGIAGYGQPAAAGGYDYFTVRLDRTAVPFCFGDGSGTACPCGNASPAIAQAGCLSSLGTGGLLIDAGASSLSGDTLVLHGSDMPSSSALYFQGTTQLGAGLGVAFGDGLRCAGGSTVRLATKTNAAGISQYPAAGDPSVSVRGAVVAPGMRTYQVWYRNAAAFCTPSTFNLTNGLRVTWVP